MDLLPYDGKLVRISDDNGDVFEGLAEHYSADYNMHEYGWDEDGLMIDNWLFLEKDIKEVKVIEEKEKYIWMNSIQHDMKLDPGSFDLVQDGKKTIELRLYDEKRQQVQKGDVISFANTEDETEIVKVRVEDLYVFDSFKELYEKLPLKDCGYAEKEIADASYTDMDRYYSKEQQEKYKVVGIRIKTLAE